MPLFKIIPTNSAHATCAVTVESADAILRAVSRLDCQEADVFTDAAYSFTMQLAANGLWTIYQRKGVEAAEMPMFG